MTLQIALYLVVGAVFGLATYSHRHFFSEGGTRPQASSNALEGRAMWCAICSALWPLFVATGAWNLVRLAGKSPRPGAK